MKPEQVPQKWVEAAFKAARVGSDALAPGWMQRALAAVAPLIAAQEREQAATLLDQLAALSSNPHDVDAWQEAAAAIRAMGDDKESA